VDTDQVEIVVPEGDAQDDSPVRFDDEPAAGAAPAEGGEKDAIPVPSADDDAAKALEKALQGDKK